MWLQIPVCSRAHELPHNMRNTLHTDKHKCMHLVCRHLTIRHLSHLFLSFSTCVSLCVNGVMANCCILSVFLHLCLFLPLSTFLSSCLVCLSHFSPFWLPHLFLFSALSLSPLLLVFPSSLSSGCVKFSWGSERLAFKPGGRRTRFLSTPCLALCV